MKKGMHGSGTQVKRSSVKSGGSWPRKSGTAFAMTGPGKGRGAKMDKPKREMHK